MITAKNALTALVNAGLAASWTSKRTDEYGHKVTDFKVQSDNFSVSNETYGKKSFLYFRCQSPDIAYALINVLKKCGARPCTGWNGGPDHGCFELPVSYFKGRRWWE